MRQVYVALGGNIGDTAAVFNRALGEIAQLSEVCELETSCFYQTTPVGEAEQREYINAVCTFKTSLTAEALHAELQKVEQKLGKIPKPKESPRIIDLDILFYGTEWHDEKDLQVPHPRWEERLFVLVPLADLTEDIVVPDAVGQSRRVNLLEKLRNFPNKYNETVRVLNAKQ